MSCSSTINRGGDDADITPLYDHNIPHCGCGIKAELRIVGPNKPTKGKLYFACSKKPQGCKFFRWCLPISRTSLEEDLNDEVTMEDESHIRYLQSKIDMLEENEKFLKKMAFGLLLCLIAAMGVIFSKV